jgi:hypothetical protein
VSALAFGIGDWDIGEISVRIDETSSMLDSKVVSIALQSPKYDCNFSSKKNMTAIIYLFLPGLSLFTPSSMK